MQISRLFAVSASVAAFGVVALAQAPATKPPMKMAAKLALPSMAKATPKLTIDQLVEIKHPSGHQWTPDGSHVWFTYDDGGVNNLWAAPADGAGPAIALTSYPDGQVAGGFWTPDSKMYYFTRGTALMQVPVTGGTPGPAAWASAGASGFSVSPDGARVAYLVGSGRAAGGRGRGGRGRGAAVAAPAPVADTGPAPAAMPSGGSDSIVRMLVAGTETTLAHVDGSIGGMAWSPDGTKLAYTTTAGRAASTSGSDLIVASIADGSHASIVHDDGAMGAPSWTPGGAYLTYSMSAGGGAAANAAPSQILTSPPEIGAKLIFVTNTGGRNGAAGGGGAMFIVPSAGGTPKPVSTGRAGGGGGGGGGRGGGGSNWLDATHQLSSTTSNGGKTRTTMSMDVLGGGEPMVLHTETEDKFFSQVNATAAAISPDHKWLAYTADTTGWDQIYVMPTSGGLATQLTKVPGEHWRASWSHDSTKLAWDTNTSETPGDRQIEFAVMGDDPAKATIVAVTSGKGTNISAEWSPDDSRILFQHTDAQNSADLYVAPAMASAKTTRLTSSMPASIDHSIFVAPELIHYPGPDGKMVPAWLFVPKNLDKTKKHAAIVWIHPDGVNQNYDGWHTSRQEAVYYEMHQYLLQQGYVVIAPDYRGSIGYGRDWRNDVYMDVGGNDAKDARMAATYLKTLGYVDPDRMGVWGLSYGGFFTLLAVTQEPTWFKAAVDVAGVVDYALYYEDPYHGGWTTSRIGTPEEHPDVYAKANPMAHVDQIKNPLMILAGTADTNVPFIESALLVDKLLKAGKGSLVTFMMYPGEFHYFDRSFVVRDAWQRVDAFFGQHLHPEVATSK